jgi:hypothetical protein
VSDFPRDGACAGGRRLWSMRRSKPATRLGDWLSLEAVLRPSDTLRRELDQAFAVQVEVDQREVGAEPVIVLF